MAATILCGLLLRRNVLAQEYMPIMYVCRFASKKSGGASKNQGKNRKGKHLGIKRSDGERVIPGTILVRQRGYKFHPGVSVGVGRDHTLYALREGIVRYRMELLEPYPWALGRQGPIHERKFVHVESKEPMKNPELVLVEAAHAETVPKPTLS